MDESSVALAIDIGGTKVAAGVVDAAGQVLSQTVAAAPTTTDPEEFFSTVVTAGRQAIAQVDADARSDPVERRLAGVGCGCGGPMRWPEGLVVPLNIPSWRLGFPLRQRLHEAFDGKPTLVHNDAVALAAGEHWQGTGQGHDNLLCVTVSTGVGGGLVFDGSLFHGKTGNAGHVGHVCVEPDGPVCACGARGCLEAVASGPSSVRYALAQGWSPPTDAAADGKALAASAESGDQVAVDAVARSGRAVGLALASCANFLDLEVAVVAGGFSRTGDLFWRPLEQAFAQNAVMSFAAETKVCRSESVESIPLIGAAAFVLVPDRYGWPVDGEIALP